MCETVSDRTPLLDGELLGDLRRRLVETEGLLLCLDFDGTLAPVVDDPDRAAMTDANEAALRRLAHTSGVHVAVVSGRSLSDLRDRVDLDGVHYAGNHGFEWSDGDGRTVTPTVRSVRPAMERAVAELREAVADVPGCTVADRGLTATVHYRETPERRRPDVVEAVGSVLVSEDSLQYRRGRATIAVLPDLPVDTGTAIDRLRERQPGSLPLFIGADRTDTDGFHAVADDGFGVAVGDGTDTNTAARVADPDGVAMLLGWLVQTVGGPAPPTAGDDPTHSAG